MNDATCRAEEHFSQLVAEVQDYAVFLLDATGHVGSWNAGAERINGYTAEEVIGKHFSMFYVPETLCEGGPARELRIAAETGRFSDEDWRIRKDGTQFWASIVLTALHNPDGSIRGFLKITRDLTERKRGEETLRRNEEQFRLLVEGVQDCAIFILNPDGTIASWNLGAERIKGYKASEIIGKHFSCFYPPESLAEGRPERGLRTALEKGRFEDEGWRMHKSGSRFWASVIITPLYDKEGGLHGFAKVTRDLSDRRRIETLKEADRQKDQFLAILAHELRNPLAPIRNALHILGQAGASAEDKAMAWETAGRQVRHMGKLVDDLLDLARISQGMIELHKEPIDLRELIERTAESMRLSFEKRGHQLSVRISDQPLWIDADSMRLEQVLVNLLGNAAKYTEPGGRIELIVEKKTRDVAVTVRDSGIGIEAAMLSRIFEPFVQGQRRLDRAAGGVGIGLAVAKQVAELHGGSIAALSAGSGCGSEFVVLLPIYSRRPDPEERRLEPQTSADANARLRILIVDDNVDGADSLGILLRIAGHDVRVAYEGVSALALVPDFKPQIALLDVGMPGMDGCELASRLRQMPETNNSLLVAITGWGQQEDIARSKKAGFDHHLVKPVEPSVLQKLLEERRAGIS